jgi:hypothetical protein
LLSLAVAVAEEQSAEAEVLVMGNRMPNDHQVVLAEDLLHMQAVCLQQGQCKHLKVD